MTTFLSRLWRRLLRRPYRRALGRVPAGDIVPLDRDIVTVLTYFRG